MVSVSTTVCVSLGDIYAQDVVLSIFLSLVVFQHLTVKDDLLVQNLSSHPHIMLHLFFSPLSAPPGILASVSHCADRSITLIFLRAAEKKGERSQIMIQPRCTHLYISILSVTYTLFISLGWFPDIFWLLLHINISTLPCTHKLIHHILSSAAVFPINTSSQYAPTSACHRTPPHPDSTTQDQSRSHVSVTLTPRPPAISERPVNMPTAAFYVTSKGRAYPSFRSRDKWSYKDAPTLSSHPFVNTHLFLHLSSFILLLSSSWYIPLCTFRFISLPPPPLLKPWANDLSLSAEALAPSKEVPCCC